MAGEDARRARLQDAIRTIRRLQKRVDELENSAREPIAVVGLGCRFPGDVNGPEDYWRLLRDRIDGITEVPADRWDAARFYDPDPEKPGKMYTSAGGFVPGPDLFDADLFGLSPREVAKIDPQHRAVLEVAWEALEHAGIAPKGLEGSATGVYVGITLTEYGEHQTLAGDESIDAYTMTGTKLNFAAGRLSYLLGLQGPAIALDTACSSSLVAVHTAVRALRNGDCDLALAGGVNTILTPQQMIAECKSRMLSPQGRCRTFDAAADGFVRGEGTGILVLERLSTALEKGHEVIAVLRGSAVNQDGASSGLTVPNRIAQEAVIRSALANAGLTPDDIDYVEAHGTATPLGDPIEVRALANVFAGRSEPLRIGSVKTNIGHLESASGAAGLIKVIVGLQHDTMPPQLHLENLTSAVDWSSIPVEVVTESLPWPATNRARCAGISSFGASGTNAHIVVEDWKAETDHDTPQVSKRPLQVYPLSAATEASLAELALRHEQALAQLAEHQLADACHTVGAGRSHLRERVAVVGAKVDDIREGLRAFLEGRHSDFVFSAANESESRCAFLFPGRLGTDAEIAKSLYGTQPVFTARLDECADILDSELDVPLREILFGRQAADNRHPACSEPALVALQYALAHVWLAWGVKPAVVAGYGCGEYAAACIAGALSLHDALRLAVARGVALQALSTDGAMVAVASDRESVEKLLDGSSAVSIAAINGPQSVVISGPSEEVAKVCANIRHQGIRTHDLATERAEQSAAIEPQLERFARTVGEIKVAAPRTRLISGVDGEAVSASQTLDLAHWQRQLRETIRYLDAAEAVASERIDTFVEIGPGCSMLQMTRSCPSDRPAVWAPSLEPGEDDWTALMRSLAVLYAHGVDIDWRGVDSGFSCHTLRLPTYAFDRKRHWIDAPMSVADVGGTTRLDAYETDHPLLGCRLRSPLDTAQYAALIGLENAPWVADHNVFDRTVVPATAYLEMLFSAASRTAGTDVDIEDVFIHTPIVIDGDNGVAVQTLVDSGKGNQRLRIVSRTTSSVEGDVWVEHVSARYAPRDAVRSGSVSVADIDAIAARCGQTLSTNAHYKSLEKTGVTFGPAFHTVDGLQCGDGEALGRVQSPGGTMLDSSGYWMHPAMLDGCFQVSRAALPAALRDDPQVALVPMRLGRLSVFDAPASSMVVHAKVKQTTESGHSCDVNLLIMDEQGRRIAELQDLRLARADRAALDAAGGRRSERHKYQLMWRAKSLPELSPAREVTSNWLVFGYGDATAGRYSDALREVGMNVWTVGTGDHLAVNAGGESTLCVAEADHYNKLLEAALASDDGDWNVLHIGAAHSCDDEPDVDVLRDVNATHLQSLLNIAQALEALAIKRVRLIIATHGAQQDTSSTGLSNAPLWGFGRVVQSELPKLRTLLVDLEDEPGAAAHLLRECAANDAETQVLYRGATRYVARLKEFDGLKATSSDSGPRRLTLGTPGIPDSLAMRPMQRQAPGPGEVEIEVAVSGLNFRDVLVALGVYQGPSGPLGGECSGKVIALGEGVDHLRVGDEVIAFATGSLATHVTTDARLVWLVPALLDQKAAATIPITFLTSAYCLDYLGRMSAGDRVLIHGAAGGVGMAAIQLAKLAGAEIFGTAGTVEKRKLIKELGVDHAFDSRTTDFADQIMELTDGEGVDIVLNSLAGEFIPQSLRVTSNGGRFVEIGRTDIWSPEQVGEERPDLEYHTVLLGDVCEQDPDLIHSIGERLCKHLETGALQPLPRTSWPMQDAADAFRLMARAGHTGKLVLTVDRGSVADDVDVAATVRADSGYLVTGGYGGLGLETARWLVDRGASVVGLMGRHGADGDAAHVVDELCAQGATVLSLIGDAAQEADAKDAIAQIEKEGVPLRGIVHAAGTIDDGVIPEQNWSRIAGVLEPKVAGAWVLHQATADRALDFFVLFSSASALFGASGQAGYAAGNAFMDALARWRRRQGLAALSVNWGPWAGAGMVAESGDAAVRAVTQLGFRMLPASENLAILGELLDGGAAEAGVFEVDWGTFVSSQSEIGMSSLLSEVAEQTATDAAQGPDQAFLDELRGCPQARRKQLMQRKLRTEVAAVLGTAEGSVPLTQGFRELGMDSLMSVELRNRIERLLGCSLVSTLAFDYPNVEVLADFLLGEVITGDNEDAAKLAQAEEDEIGEEVADLSDEDAERVLLEELNRMRGADQGG